MGSILGKHILAEFCGCNREVLNDREFLMTRCVTAAERINATVVAAHSHRFDPIGISIVLILAESHLSLHSWPEHSFASMDVFTCGENDPTEAVNFIASALTAEDVRVLNVDRGIGDFENPRWRFQSQLARSQTHE